MDTWDPFFTTGGDNIWRKLNKMINLWDSINISGPTTRLGSISLENSLQNRLQNSLSESKSRTC